MDKFDILIEGSEIRFQRGSQVLAEYEIVEDSENDTLYMPVSVLFTIRELRNNHVGEMGEIVIIPPDNRMN